MVKLPKEFVPTKYSGYFWNVADKQLYSVKVTGELKPLKFRKRDRWQHYDGYQVSVNGECRSLGMDYLTKLKPVTADFPVWSE